MSRRIDAAPWVMLGVAMLAQAGSSVLQQGLGSIAPLFQAEWALSRAELGVLLGAVNVGVLLASLPAGQLVDRVGERRPMIAGPLGVGVVSLLASLSPSPWLLTAVLVVAGAFLASQAPSGGKAMLLWFPARVRGLAMSLRQASVTLVGILGALTLPALAAALGWRGALAAAGAFSIGAAAVVALCYHEPPALSVTPPRERLGLRAIPHLLHDRSLVATLALGPILVCGQWIVVPYLGLFLYERFGWSVAEAASYLAIAQLGGMLGRVAWGLASDLIWAGRRKPALGLLVPASALGSLGLALLPNTAPAVLVGALAFALGVSAIGWNGLLLAYIAEQAGPYRAGTALGLSLTMIFVSGVLAPPLFGLAVDRAGSYTPAWLGLSVVLLAGLALFPLMREVARD